MRRLRTRQWLVLFAIGLVVIAGCLAAVSPIYSAVLTPLWLVVPTAVVVTLRRRAVRSDEQPVPLLSLLLSRAPPVLAARG